MPELPEVEIIKKSLIKNIKSRKINKVIVRNNRLRFKLEKNFKKILHRNKINNIYRFSKYIILELRNNNYCIFHLGMSGTIHLIKKNNINKITNTSFYHSPFLPKKHNHIEFIFDNIRMIYNDPRRFGFFLMFRNYESLNKYFLKMGPEPLNKKFNLNYVKRYMHSRKKNIKNILLDQKFVSGLGNIYVNEVLFYSKINPMKKGKNLKINELKNLIKFSKATIISAIKKGGSSIQNFTNTIGKKGNFQKFFKVYNQNGKKCSNKGCDGIIIKLFISNRSTFICKKCQK
tara:strand:- start:1759 stop:2622 length:864 start_codon:yes stop_codon:yes gene_type:complete